MTTNPLEQATPHRWIVVHGDEGYAAPLTADEASPAGAQLFSLIPPPALPDVPPGETISVHENAQSFDITYYDFGAYHGLYHHRGENWIFWDHSTKHYAVSSAQGLTDKAWVNIRYIMRHTVVDGLLTTPGRRRLHAVTGILAGGADDGILIIGPYLSGKTVLLNTLIRAGVVSELVEDDCAVIDSSLVNFCLIPQRDEKRALRRLNIRAIVCLDKEITTPQAISAESALSWGVQIQASWPFFWLPHDSRIETTLHAAPPDVPALRLPEKPDLAAVRDWGLGNRE